jgi:hypothetical protein
MNAHLVTTQVSLFHVWELPTIPSPTTPCCPWVAVWFSPQGLPRVSGPKTDTPPFQWVGASFGLRHSLAGSPQQQAESSSSSYGLAVHLRLLSTPSRDDAVTLGYKVQTKPWRGLAPRCSFRHACRRTSDPLQRVSPSPQEKSTRRIPRSPGNVSKRTASPCTTASCVTCPSGP